MEQKKSVFGLLTRIVVNFYITGNAQEPITLCMQDRSWSVVGRQTGYSQGPSSSPRVSEVVVTID